MTTTATAAFLPCGYRRPGTVMAICIAARRSSRRVGFANLIRTQVFNLLALAVVLFGGMGEVGAQEVRAQEEFSSARTAIVEKLRKLAKALDDEANQTVEVGKAVRANPNAALSDVETLKLRNWQNLAPQVMRKDGENSNSDETPRRTAEAVISHQAETSRSFGRQLLDVANRVETSSSPEGMLAELDRIGVPDVVKDIVVAPSDGLPNEHHIEITPFGAGGGADRFALPLDAPGLFAPDRLTDFVLGPGASETVDFPAVGALLYDRAGQGAIPFCTGTLISEKVVLTAAHCFCDLRYKGASFFKTESGCRAARYDRLGTPTDALSPVGNSVFFQHAGNIPVERIVIHEKFDWPNADLALVFLKDSVTDIAPIRINRVAAVPKGTWALIVGFGAHGALDATGNPVAAVPVPHSEGLKNFAYVKTGDCNAQVEPQKFVCWTFFEKVGDRALGSTCMGDSGGPLLIGLDGGWYLAGTTSGGATCRPGDQPFDISVFDFADWVDQFVPGLSVGADTEVGGNKLRPVLNIGRYVALAGYRRFFNVPESWIKTFNVPPGTAKLRLAANSTPTDGTLSVGIRTAAGNPNQMGCEAGGDDVAYACEVEHPAEGAWELTVRGGAPQEFQIVTTTF